MPPPECENMKPVPKDFPLSVANARVSGKLSRQAKALGPIPGSSEVLESIIGKYKLNTPGLPLSHNATPVFLDFSKVLNSADIDERYHVQFHSRSAQDPTRFATRSCFARGTHRGWRPSAACGFAGVFRPIQPRVRGCRNPPGPRHERPKLRTSLAAWLGNLKTPDQNGTHHSCPLRSTYPTFTTAPVCVTLVGETGARSYRSIEGAAWNNQRIMR